jgi:hypothetical protein
MDQLVLTLQAEPAVLVFHLVLAGLQLIMQVVAVVAVELPVVQVEMAAVEQVQLHPLRQRREQ